MLRPRRIAALACVAALHASLALAQPAAPRAPAPMPGDTVLADNGIARVTRADYDLELTRLPPDMRGGFATSEKRVADLISRLLVTRTLAALADREKLLDDPEAARRFAAETERMKSQLMLSRVEREAAEAFDANPAPFEARARDLYVVDPRKFDAPPEIAVSHVLFATPPHSVEEATRLAAAARSTVLAGADFAALARERSEDPSAKANAGSLGTIRIGQTDPAFERAAFALARVGEVSEPVRTDFGVHLIRLDARKEGRPSTFDQVKPRLMAEQRQRHIDGQREAFVEKLREDAAKALDTAKVGSMVIRVDPATLERVQRELGQRQQERMRDRAGSTTRP